jgi:16S rRNA (cytosine967-C5)-methyltransferase
MWNRTEHIIYPDHNRDPILYLSTFYSHPEWMVERWLSRYDRDATEALLRFNNQAPSMTIRANTLKTNRCELLDVLKAEGVQARPGIVSESGIIIESLPAPLFRLASYRQGLYYVQGESTIMLIGPGP